MIEGSGSESGAGSGSTPLINGSGSERPKMTWIRWIRNTCINTYTVSIMINFFILKSGTVCYSTKGQRTTLKYYHPCFSFTNYLCPPASHNRVYIYLLAILTQQRLHPPLLVILTFQNTVYIHPCLSSPNIRILTINVPLFKKLRDIIFFCGTITL
jgi:hypothetical protein